MLDTGIGVINSAFGGTIISFVICLHLFVKGKVTGLLNCFSKLVALENFYYNSSLIAGMVFVSSFFRFNFDDLNKEFAFYEEDDAYVKDLSILGFCLAGFLVGFGGNMSSACGCSSILVGVPNRNKRSIFAAIAMMGGAILIATIRYYLPFFSHNYIVSDTFSFTPILIDLFMIILSLLVVAFWVYKAWQKDKNLERIKDSLIAFIIGCILSYGVIESGLAKRHIVSGFFTVGTVWSVRLLIIIILVVLINFFAFQLIFKRKTPLLEEGYEVDMNQSIDLKMLVGASLFGFGWGISGVSPLTIPVVFYCYEPQTVLYTCFLLIGIYVENLMDEKLSDLLEKHKFFEKSSFAEFHEEALNKISQIEMPIHNPITLGKNDLNEINDQIQAQGENQ